VGVPVELDGGVHAPPLAFVRGAGRAFRRKTLRKRAELFDELRTALRLYLPHSGPREQAPEASQQELQDIRVAVDSLTLSLQERRPQRGPAQDTRRAIDLILAHLHRHGDSLWGHAIVLPPEAGDGVRIVSRTNNLLEGVNRAMKQGVRRRSGRENLAADLEHLPPEAALACNLLCPDYVEILYGSLDQLPQTFAELDALRRQRVLSAESHCSPASRPNTAEIASASLPKADRQLVRSDAMSGLILAAARISAPRANATPARC